MLSILGTSTISVLIISIIWFIISLVRHRNDVADIGWGTYFILLGFIHFFITKPAVDMRLIPLGLVFIWGIRLMVHIGSRHARTGEDARYGAWRNAWGSGWYFYVRSFLQVFVLQGILAMIIATPLILIATQTVSLQVTWVIIGTLVWIGGFICESVADAQLRTFLMNPENKGHLMQSGLWNYSRHPNYFGEVVQWFGIAIIGFGTWIGFLGIIGPITITFLILYVSGVPLAEKSLAQHPEFAHYRQRTRVFFPWFPSRH